MTHKEHPHIPLLVILLFAALQIAVGVWVGIVQLSHADYVKCTYRYDREFKAAFDRVARSSEAYQIAQFQWISTLPPLFVGNATEAQVDKSREKLDQYIVKFNELQEAREIANFPGSPTEFCGHPPEQ